MDSCPHDLAERESACANGYCPLCMEEKLASIPKAKPPMDKPAEGLARIRDRNGMHGFFVGENFVFIQRHTHAIEVAKWINTAHASIVKPLREKAALLRELEEEGNARVHELQEKYHASLKDSDAWKEKAEDYEKELSRQHKACYSCAFTGEPMEGNKCPSCGETMPEKSIAHEWEKLLQDASRLEETLKLVKTKGRHWCLNAPGEKEIKDCLACEIEKTLAAHKKLKGGA